jgi:hypothetical protein
MALVNGVENAQAATGHRVMRQDPPNVQGSLARDLIRGRNHIIDLSRKVVPLHTIAPAVRFPQEASH